MLRSAVLLLVLMPCLAVERLPISWSGNLTAKPTTTKTDAVNSPTGDELQAGAAAQQVQSWSITSTSNCSKKSPLLVEIWEDRTSAAAAPPLLDNRVFCPVISSLDYPALAAQPPLGGAKPKDQSDYQLWESFVARPWHTDVLRYVDSLWWDTEACARQLPYHRILVAVDDIDPYPKAKSRWWVHAINRRNSPTPQYKIRATCAAAIPCPEPVLGSGPCSGRGVCKRANVLVKQPIATTVCDCKAGWAGVGCEVEVPSLPLDTPTTLVPVYNPDMKLTWNLSLNTAWSLVQLEVPESVQQLVLELEVDWSGVDVQAPNVSAPRLCFVEGGLGYSSFGASGEVTAAGRLRVHSVLCQQPLSFPMTSRSGYQNSDLGWYRGSKFMKYSQVLVMDVGPYPVKLTAHISRSSKRPICPFNCSGNLVQEGARCEDFGCYCGVSSSDTSGWQGQYCEYSMYGYQSSPASLKLGASMNTQLMHLDAGKSVPWVVLFHTTPTAASRLIFNWESSGGSNLEGLSVGAYHLADFEEIINPPVVAKELCWTETRSPVRFDLNKCFKVNFTVSEYYSWTMPGNRMAFYFKNSGISRISFTASLSVKKKKKFEGPKRTAAIVVPVVVAGGAVLLVGLYMARRYHQRLAASAPPVAPGAAAAAAAGRAVNRHPVPQGVIDTFPTQIYSPAAVPAAPSQRSNVQHSSLDTAATGDKTVVSTLEGTNGMLQASEVEPSGLKVPETASELLPAGSQTHHAAGAPSSGGYGRVGSGARDSALGSMLRRAGRALSGGRSAAPNSSEEALARNTCTICLGEYEAGEVLRRLPCLHSFHQPCIDAWMVSNNTCPICRLDLMPSQSAFASLATTPLVSPV